jgi:hypothetical protein
MTNLYKFLYRLKLSEENFNGLFKCVKDVIEQGVSDANSKINKDPEQFDYRGARAIFLNSSVKKIFRRRIYESSELQSVKHIRSHGVDYFLINGSFLLCFKKMDKKARVSSFYSKRFQETINGGKVKYSKKMLDILGELGILKPLPIFFTGYVLDPTGRLENIFLVNYKLGKIENVVSLKELFTPDLFTINEPTVTENQKLVTVKKKSRLAANY